MSSGTMKINAKFSMITKDGRDITFSKNGKLYIFESRVIKQEDNRRNYTEMKSTYVIQSGLCHSSS